MHRNKNFISLIIATYNTGNLIEKTLQSIFDQSYQNFEVIIVDGASDIVTISCIEKYKLRLAYYISEPDMGIYDAWNKGLAQAQGEWIAFLGAGDEYVPEALQSYIDLLYCLPDNIEFISSRVAIVDENGKSLYIRGKPWCWPKFLSSMTCAHVGALHSNLLFERLGTFNTTYKIAGDYEFLMRAGDKLKTAFLPKITVYMLNGGVSTSSSILKEDRRLKITTGNKPIWKANLEFIKNNLKQFARKIIKFQIL